MHLRIDGKINFLLLVGVLALVLMSGLWKPGIVFDVMGTRGHAAGAAP